LSFRFESPIHAPKILVFWGFYPQNLGAHRSDPQKAQPCVISRVLSYPSTGLTYASLRKKGINKKGTKTLYFTHFRRSHQWMDLYQIWFRGSSRGHNQLCGILWQSAQGLRFCRGGGVKICHLPLTWPVAVTQC